MACERIICFTGSRLYRETNISRFEKRDALPLDWLPRVPIFVRLLFLTRFGVLSGGFSDGVLLSSCRNVEDMLVDIILIKLQVLLWLFTGEMAWRAWATERGMDEDQRRKIGTAWLRSKQRSASFDRSRLLMQYR